MKKIGNIVEFIAREEREQVMIYGYEYINRVVLPKVRDNASGICKGFAGAYYDMSKNCWFVSSGYHTEEEVAKWFEERVDLYNSFKDVLFGSLAITSMLMFETDGYYKPNWGLRAACLFEDEI